MPDQDQPARLTAAERREKASLVRAILKAKRILRAHPRQFPGYPPCPKSRIEGNSLPILRSLRRIHAKDILDLRAALNKLRRPDPPPKPATRRRKAKRR